MTSRVWDKVDLGFDDTVPKTRGLYSHLHSDGFPEDLGYPPICQHHDRPPINLYSALKLHSENVLIEALNKSAIGCLSDPKYKPSEKVS